MNLDPGPEWPAPQAINALLRGPVDLPFPIISPFSVRGDLQKLADGVAGLLRFDEQYPDYARARLAGLARGVPGFLAAPSDDSEVIRQRLAALVAFCQVLANACPVAFGLDSLDRSSPSAPWLQFKAAGLAWRQVAPGNRHELTALRDDAIQMARLVDDWSGEPADEDAQALTGLALCLALNMQEDFVLMGAATGLTGAAGDSPDVLAGEAIAEAMVVSFPSGWSPPEKVGRSLTQIHAPVADGEALQRASRGLSLAMLEKGPFVRHVWTLSDGPELDRRPDSTPGSGNSTKSMAAAAYREAVRPGSVDQLWFRCERQTTLALPALRRALFLIRVYRAPLPTAAHSPQRRQQLVDALRSMSPAIIAYKNIGHARDIVLRAWGA